MPSRLDSRMSHLMPTSIRSSILCSSAVAYWSCGGRSAQRGNGGSRTTAGSRRARSGAAGSIRVDGRLDEAAVARRAAADGVRPEGAGRGGAADRPDGSALRVRRRRRCTSARGCTRTRRSRRRWGAATTANRPSTCSCRSIPTSIGGRRPRSASRRPASGSITTTPATTTGERRRIRSGVAGADVHGRAGMDGGVVDSVFAAALHRSQTRRCGD